MRAAPRAGGAALIVRRGLFMGACGVRPGGQVMDTTVAEVPARRAMIAAGDKVVLMADRTKFPGAGMVKICGSDELDVLVTDASADDATCVALGEAGVQVVSTAGVARDRAGGRPRTGGGTLGVG